METHYLTTVILEMSPSFLSLDGPEGDLHQGTQKEIHYKRRFFMDYIYCSMVFFSLSSHIFLWVVSTHYFFLCIDSIHKLRLWVALSD